MKESITVERVRHALVVGRLDQDGAAVLLAANLPPKRDRTYVVVGASSVDAMTRLDPWVIADLADEVRGDVCVVAPGFGSMGEDGKLPPARLLADRLGVEVTAADGDPVGLADGSVYVPGPTAGWVAFRPGGRRIRIGARFPAPWWQNGLPEPADHITHVPAGLWVREPDSPDRPTDPLLHQVPDRDRMYLVLGAPGEKPPTAETVAEVLRTLPDEARDRAVLAWYGPGSESAAAVAEALGAPIRVAHGVPGDGGLVYVDETGKACWRPFAVESVYRPGQAPVLDRWTAPPGLPMAEPGSYKLAAGWRVDVVARGLAVHPESVRVNEALAAETGPTADVVVVTEGPLPAEVREAFDNLIRELPADTRNALRILPADEKSAEALAAVEAADRVVEVAEPQAAATQEQDPTGPPVGAVVVTADGRVLPATPILAIPTDAAPVLDIQDGVLTLPLPEEDQPGELPRTAAAAIAPPRLSPLPATAETGLPLMRGGGWPVVAIPPAAATGLPAAAEAAQPAGLAAVATGSPAATPLAASGSPAADEPAARQPNGFGAERPAPLAAAVPPVGEAAAQPEEWSAVSTAMAGSAATPTPVSNAPFAAGESATEEPENWAAGPATTGSPATPTPVSNVPSVAPGLPAVGELAAKRLARLVAAPPAAAESATGRPSAGWSMTGELGLADERLSAPIGAVPLPAVPQPDAASAATTQPAPLPAMAAAAAPLAASQPASPPTATPPTAGQQASPLAAVLPTSTQPASLAGALPSVASSIALPSVVMATQASLPGTDSVAGLLPGRAKQETQPAPQQGAPVEVPEDARSTPAQRRAMRGKLGSRYDVATRAVSRLLSERPGLRFGAGDRAALLTELAVVRVFATEPDGDYDTDFYVCLADGLRRLPTARSVVVRGIPADTDVRPESIIRLPTPVVAAPVSTAGPVGPAEALIWTTTARRLDGLLDSDDAEDEDKDTRDSDVVLSGHTRLRVLAVEAAPIKRILLAEDGAAQEAALTRLRAAAASRSADGQPLSNRWFGPLPAA